MVKHIIEYNVCVGDEVRFERMDGMFQYVSGCFKGIQVYFPICFTMGRFWFNSFRCFFVIFRV